MKKLSDLHQKVHVIYYSSTVVSCKYAPLFCMLGLGKRGEGLMRGIMAFPHDDHYRPTITTWTHDLCTFSGRLIDKTGEKRQSGPKASQVL